VTAWGVYVGRRARLYYCSTIF